MISSAEIFYVIAQSICHWGLDDMFPVVKKTFLPVLDHIQPILILTVGIAVGKERTPIYKKMRCT
jgi:hypothetical protein